uniref:Uncharacterized protein n=1 Tax=Cuerna arida TaxID=1464854 RepID=A0A1B6EQB8_9HEMI
MTTLKERMLPDEYEKFTSQGFFTIRRTDKFWSGTWTDMTIEQSLMKLMKSRGGVTHGRGVSESVLAMWTLGMVATQNICEEVERFCNVSFTTSEQHVELRTSRINRDNRNVNKLVSWFQQHCPFPEKTYLMSLSTGLVGDDRINCHNAEEIGEVGVANVVGKDFASITFKRKDRVKPLEVMTSSIPVEGESVLINPTSLFQRISIVKQSDEELENFLSYELAPYPLSLFNENGMRKGTKSALYKAFQASDQSLDLKNSIVVVDGGFLLHRVVWGKGISFSNICNKYVNYVIANYDSTATVVFDGYPEVSIVRGTKQYERNRRSRKHVSTTLDISDNLVPSISQENKRRLIGMLMDKFKSAHVSFKQAEEDEDTMIVETAVDLTSQHDSVVVVGEDIDLLVLMIASSCSSKLHFVKPGKGKASHQIYTCSTALTNSMILETFFLFMLSVAVTRPQLHLVRGK